MKRSPFVAVAILLPVLSTLTAKSLYGQVGADRVAVTGLVTDPSGAAIPGATVTLINQETSVKTVIATNSAGNYTTPAMVLGSNYTLQVEKAGFRTYVHPALDLTIGGRTYTENVTLEVGKAIQTIQVRAATPLINTQSSTVSYDVGANYYKNLPDVMGADVRLAETKLVLTPGYIPTAPNGDAIFRGDAFFSRINGGQTESWESWFDGAEYGYAEGHQQTHESSIPYASVRELTTTVNNFSAQYGHTSGGLALYTTKSGTDKFHGNLYDFYTSSGVDANNFFLNSSGVNILPLSQDNSGFDFGGPIPKIHKWGKTFWFTNYDRLDYHSTVNIGYQNTLPTVAERAGDFSELMSPPAATLAANGCSSAPCQVGTDALGRPIYYGELFNPATTRFVNGVPVRDPYPGNMIPSTDPLEAGNKGGLKVNSLEPPLDRNTLFTPNEFGGTSDDNDKINVWTWLLRVDHTFSPKWTASVTYFQNHRPRTAHCGGPQGCSTVNNGQTDSAANDTYIGQGFYQLITNHFIHFQLSTVIKPNLFNHATLAYDRWVMNGHQLSSGVGWNQVLGLGLPNQPIFNNAGFPSLNFSGGPTGGYTNDGTPWLYNGNDISNRYQFYDDLTWIVGKHTFEAGLQSAYFTFPQTGWADDTGGTFNFHAQSVGGFNSAGAGLPTTGDAYAAFLLGQVDYGTFQYPINYMPRFWYAAPWVNDSWKVMPKLTLELGLRLDWNSHLSEEFGRFSTFSPTTPNPGAGNHPGAMLFGPKYAYGNDAWGLGPRFGFAYQLGNNSVIRGGFGEYFGPEIQGSASGYPINGYQTFPTVANTSGDVTPTYYFGSGFPASAITVPPDLSPSVMNGGSPVGVLPNSYEMPRYLNWSISYGHQFGSNISINAGYVGNHATRLYDNAVTLGPYANENPGNVLKYGGALTNGAFTNGVPNAAAIAAGFSTPPYAGFTGDLAQALLPWPQYQGAGILWRMPHDGMSHFNSFQAQFNWRGRHNSTTVAYTLSRLINNSADQGEASVNNVVQNPSNMNDLYGPSYDDVPNVLTIGEVFHLPFGQGQFFGQNATGLLGKLISHWDASGVLSYQSGRPLVMYVDNNLAPLLFNNAKYPNLVSGANPVSDAAFYSNPQTHSYFNPAAFSVPGLFSFGNAPRTTTSIRGPHYYNEDLDVYKDTYFGEEKYVRFEAEFGNIFNRVDFCNPDTNIQDGSFGESFTQCNVARRIQFGLQLFF
jgi:hypothetical protein